MIHTSSLLALPLVLAPLTQPGVASGSESPGLPITLPSVCATSATLAARAGIRAAEKQLFLDLAYCLNTSDPEAQAACLGEIWASYQEALDDVDAVYVARNELCELLGEELYDPEIDPRNFLTPDEVRAGGGNEYWPMEPGSTWVYEKLGEEELERIEVSVQDDTREILGVECFVVRDTVSVFDLSEGGFDEALVEDTFDYFAVDRARNVWYFGEDTWELEDGVVVSTSGRWIAGEEFAKPGIVMQAAPRTNQTYRLEYLLGQAEDVATVVALDASVTVPFSPRSEGTFDHCLQTRDFTPLSPGVAEFKFFAPGIGFVLEFDPEHPDERLELIEFSRRDGDD